MILKDGRNIRGFGPLRPPLGHDRSRHAAEVVFGRKKQGRLFTPKCGLVEWGCTLARMIILLIEEAEAIGWYEQRIARKGQESQGHYGKRAKLGKNLELSRRNGLANRTLRHPIHEGRIVKSPALVRIFSRS